MQQQMEGTPFDDPIFADFPGQTLPSLNSALLQHKSPGSSGDSGRGVHSIQVMLGLHQQHHGQQDDNYGGTGGQLDLGPLFPSASSSSDKLKHQSSDSQQQPSSASAPPASPTKPKIEGKGKNKNDGNNGVKKKKTR